jgi:site-specific DNA-methyltransferase (adenine-specific)
MKELRLLNGDCIDKLKELDNNSIDSIVTDPPYGLSFMGKKWDYDVPSVEIWQECLRVLKPGGHLLAFAGSRTYHRMAVRIEDAGFDIRDQIMWIYGSGFPKSHQLGEGWGTALKPAHEPIVMARKPFKGSCNDNHKEYGVGGLNIDGTRIQMQDGDKMDIRRYNAYHDTFNSYEDGESAKGKEYVVAEPHEGGRWPANVIMDDSDNEEWRKYFYCPKANAKDRDSGIETDAKALRTTKGGARDFNARCASCGKKFIGSPETICSCDNPITDNQVFKRKNNHPTVKPTDLMKYLIRLVTPKDGIVLDPFMGSGSTGKAAMQEGMWFVGIEREKEYYEIAKQRIEYEADKRKFW